MALNFKQGSSAVRSYALVIVLVLISLGVLFLYGREGETGRIHSIQTQIAGLSAPVRSAGSGLAVAGSGAATAISDAQASDATLSALREQNRELRETIAQLEEYRQEATRLEGLLGLKDSYAAEVVTGRVVARSADPWNLMVTLDRGSADGVRSGLPVLGSTGVVGQVAQTNENSCEVRLLPDARSGVSVIIQSNRAEGIVHGSLEGVLYLENVDDDVEVKEGDVLITSGLGGGYFRGLLVGTVATVDGQVGDPDRRIVVEANAEIGPMEEAMIILSMDSEAAETMLATMTAAASSAEGAQGAQAGEGAQGAQAGAAGESGTAAADVQGGAAASAQGAAAGDAAAAQSQEAQGLYDAYGNYAGELYGAYDAYGNFVGNPAGVVETGYYDAYGNPIYIGAGA